MSSVIRSCASAALVLVAISCGGGPTDKTPTEPPPPPPVLTSITVALSAASIQVGQSSLAIASGFDQHGSPISTGTVAWTSSNTAVATVAGTGAITAISPGTVQIIATAGGKTAQASLTVTPANPTPVATVRVTPNAATIAVGGSTLLAAATLDANGNALTDRTIVWSTSDASKATVTQTGLVTGVAAGVVTITAASEGKSGSAAITVLAPAAPCTTTSAIKLNVGESRAFTATEAASMCIGGLTGASEYVLMPFNSSTIAASVTSFQLEATNTLAVATVPNLGAIDAGRLSLEPGRTDTRSLEARFRQRELQELGNFRARRRVPRRPSTARASANLIPKTLNVGDIIQLNANLNGSLCTAARVNHGSRVVAVFPHTVVVIDTLAPSGGYTDAELTSFGASFDTLAYAIDTLNFGRETDLDENERVVIFFTPGINNIPAPPGSTIGGLFTARDLFSAAPGDGCEASNEGEMFYMPVPDPNSTINGNYTNKASVGRVAIGTLAHEFQHLINASRRIYVNEAAGGEEVWLNEGLSHIAEELVYFRAARMTPLVNIDVNDVRTSQATIDAFNSFAIQNFVRYRTYLAAPASFSPFSQVDGLEMRGAIYTLLRYASDLKGGNERNTWFALVNAVTSGQTNFNSVFGNIAPIVRDWAVANFVDDLNITVPAKYSHQSWNYRSIYTGLGNPTLPLTTSALIGTVQMQLVGGGAAYGRFRVAQNTAATIVATASGLPLPANIDFVLVRTQ